MRDFEKISYEQFKKDIKDDRKLYNSFELPKRENDGVAGYDVYLLEDLEIKPNEIKKIPVGIKSYFNKDEALLIILRSHIGFEYNLRLCNQVGVIDADSYNNNGDEGHIWIKIQNESEKTVKIKKGDSIVQGIFIKYLTTKSDMIK